MDARLYALVSTARQSVTMMRAAARFERATAASDYERRNAEAMQRQAERLADAIEAAQQEGGR